MGAELVRAGRVRAYDLEKAVWGRCVGTYIEGWVKSDDEEKGKGKEGKGEGWDVAQVVRNHFWDLEKVRSHLFFEGGWGPLDFWQDRGGEKIDANVFLGLGKDRHCCE